MRHVTLMSAYCYTYERVMAHIFSAEKSSAKWEDTYALLQQECLKLSLEGNMCLCMHVCMYACMQAYVHVCMYASTWLQGSMCARMHACMYDACTQAYVHVCMYASMCL